MRQLALTAPDMRLGQEPQEEANAGRGRIKSAEGLHFGRTRNEASMGELQNQQVGAEQDDRQNREAQSNAHEHPATAQVRAMLSSQDPQAIGEIIRNNPEARSEIYALLHKSLGNQFVTHPSAGHRPSRVADHHGDGSRWTRPADAAAKGKRGTFTSDELRNIIDGDGTALDRKAAAPAAAQAPGNPSKFTPDELRNIIDGDGSALDKKQPEGPAPLPAPTPDLTSTVTAPPRARRPTSWRRTGPAAGSADVPARPAR
ncbi:MAG: hypothetical protein IPQ07_02045 [Myxococcales bacterium]|nr:hypothetical protein [Myxococcales bacterium]